MINPPKYFNLYSLLYSRNRHELEDANTHESAMTDAGNVFAAGCVCLFVRDCEKLHARKNRRSVCRAWLMSRGSSGRGEITQRKPGVASMVCAAGHCSRKNPAWLTYAASGNIAFAVLSEDLTLTFDF